jgi:hypothetical protein
LVQKNNAPQGFMRILLIDADSKIPNIALMKLSTFHKNKGNTVDFIRLDGKPFEYKDTHDTAYSSIIFTKNKDNIKGNVFLGGTGVSLRDTLSNEVEHLMPDYSLYPDNIYSIGFTTRGCFRKCDFCFVPEKEGIIKYNADITEFYNPNLKKIMLLDNNIFAYKDYKDIFEQIREIKKPTCFKQGIDFRLLNEEKIQELVSFRYAGDYIFALDSPKDIPIFEKKAPLIRKYLHPWKPKFFVLVGFDTTLEEDIKRIKLLWENKFLPYVMRHENYLNSEHKFFYIDLAAWCNQPWFVKKGDFRHFMNVRYKEGHPRIEEESTLFESLWETV